MEKVKLYTEIEFMKSFSNSDISEFAKLSEDDNPIHLDDDYASNSIFEKRVVHGVLLISMFSKIFGTIYPCNGGIYLSQSTKFIKPAFIGDLITAKATLVAFDNIKKQGIFTTECFNGSGSLILTGEAKILFPSNYEI